MFLYLVIILSASLTGDLILIELIACCCLSKKKKKKEEQESSGESEESWRNEQKLGNKRDKKGSNDQNVEA